MKEKVCVIIPAFNEELSISKVIKEVPSFVNTIVVVNNNSTDNTAENAKNAGAVVFLEERKGYGFSCLKGMEYLAKTHSDTDIVVFLDGDYSDYPEQMRDLVQPIIENKVDFVVGSRIKELRAKNAMTPQQIFGNWLACFLMKILFKSRFTDLGPFRAIRYQKLLQLKMVDKTYGWTVEMQLKALKQKLIYTEIPVKYRNRIGYSKVSGTVKGTIGAGIMIIGWIFKYAFK